MKYLHTMVRVTDLDASLRFYCDGLGLKELSRKDYPQGRFTLIFLAILYSESLYGRFAFFREAAA